MQVLGIRFCAVSEEAEALADALGPEGLGLWELEHEHAPDGDGFGGAIFPAGDGSWIEVWPTTETMPPGVMLQIVVDDADAFAEHAIEKGLSVHGPADGHGERTYMLMAPGGLAVTFQSALRHA